jgi:hypothetical protein
MGRLLRFVRLLLLTIVALSVAPASASLAAGTSAVHHEYAYDAEPSATTWHEPWTSADVFIAHALGPTIKTASSGLRLTSGGRVTTSFQVVATNTQGVAAPEPVVKASGAPNRTSAVYVNVEMPDGSIRTVGSQPGGIHAEDAAQALSPGGRTSQTYGWRAGPEGKVTWQPVGVCATCQAKYPPGMFPVGTTSAPGGAWTSK